MSHVVSIDTQVRDPVAITAACRRLGLAEPVHGTAQPFSAQATGLLLQLPGWQYPAVIDTATGSVKCDTFGGRWGDESQLDRFLQAYAVEVTRLQTRRKGYAISEQTLADGSIRLTIVEGA